MDVVTGPTQEENDCIVDMMNKLDFDECFFDEMLEDCWEFDEEEALEYYEDQDDEDILATYKKMCKKIKSGKTPFASMEDFVSAVKRFGMDDGLYYEWEGEWMELYDNIAETGEDRGYYDDFTDEEWIEILENIDKYIVKV